MERLLASGDNQANGKHRFKMANFKQCRALAASFKSNNEHKNPFSRFKYALRIYLFHRHLIDEMDAFFTGSEFRKSLLDIPHLKEDLYKQQIRRCFYKRSKKHERLHYLKSHFNFLEKIHNSNTLTKFYTQTIEPISIATETAEFSFKISYHRDLIREGYLWLTIDMEGTTLLKIIFWLMDYEAVPSLCISTIQGGRNTLDLNKAFTKHFWGIRPQNMGMQILRWYAEAYGIQQLLTFDANNIWSKKIKDRAAIADFLQEQGAQPIPGTPYVRLSSVSLRKPIADIPAKKRSLYKNRYAFLDHYSEKIKSELVRYGT